jgi:hypothetical protein
MSNLHTTTAVGRQPWPRPRSPRAIGSARALGPDGHGRARPEEPDATQHYDLTVRDAQKDWQRIRWALFVFIAEVAPTADPEVIRIFYVGKRPYPAVWRVELLQQGFDVPAQPASEPGEPSVAKARVGERTYAGAPAESSS